MQYDKIVNIQMDIQWTLQFHVKRKDYEHQNVHSMDQGRFT